MKHRSRRQEVLGACPPKVFAPTALARTALARTAPALTALVLLTVLSAQVASAADRPPTSERLVRDALAPCDAVLQEAAAAHDAIAWGLIVELPANAGPGTRLAQTLRGLVAGRLSLLKGLAQASELPAPPGTTPDDLLEGARNAGATRLLVFDTTVSGGHLHLTAAVYRVPRNFWSQIREPIAGVRATGYASARLDAELRMLLDLRVAPASSFRLDAAPEALGSAALAAGSGDIDGDGATDIVLVDGDAIRVVRWLGDVEPVTRWTWNGVPAASARPRDPFGHVVVADVTGNGRDEVLAWVSERRHAVALTWRNGALEPVEWPEMARCGGPGAVCGVPLGSLPPLRQARGEALILTEQPERGVNHFPGRLAVWRPGAELRFRASPSAYWTLTTHALVSASGATEDLTASLAADGRLTIRGETGERSWTSGAVGSAVSLTDLDDDGRAEVLYSSDAAPGARDTLTVARLGEPGSLDVVWHQTLSPIRHILAGDLNSDGEREALVLTHSGFQVLRAVSADDAGSARR